MQVAAVKEDLSGGLGAALTENLLPGESVVWCLAGLPGQAIALTTRRVMILKAGMASGAMFGTKAKAFPLREISSVEVSSGLTEGRLQLTIPGSLQERQGWVSRRSFVNEVAASRQAENICQFPSRKKGQFQGLAAAMQDAIDRQQAGASTGTGGAPTVSVGEQIQLLKQLAELKDAGVLSADEFEAKKAELLSHHITSSAPPTLMAGDPAAVDLILRSFPPNRKVDAIKALRSARRMHLAEAKRLVESVPATVLPALDPSTAKEIAGRFTRMGASVSLMYADGRTEDL